MTSSRWRWRGFLVAALALTAAVAWRQACVPTRPPTLAFGIVTADGISACPGSGIGVARDGRLVGLPSRVRTPLGIDQVLSPAQQCRLQLVEDGLQFARVLWMERRDEYTALQRTEVLLSGCNITTCRPSATSIDWFVEGCDPPSYVRVDEEGLVVEGGGRLCTVVAAPIRGSLGESPDGVVIFGTSNLCNRELLRTFVEG